MEANNAVNAQPQQVGGGGSENGGANAGANGGSNGVRENGSSGRSTPSSSSNDGSPGKLFVGGLSWQTTPEKLREYFSQFGAVNDVLVMKDPVTQVSVCVYLDVRDFPDARPRASLVRRERYLLPAGGQGRMRR